MINIIQVDNEDFETNFNIGLLFYDCKKDKKKAIHHLKIAITQEKNVTVMFNLAIIYEESGE